MKNDKKQKKETKMDNTAPRLKQLVMAFHPASCRNMQNTISQLRDNLAQNVAA